LDVWEIRLIIDNSDFGEQLSNKSVEAFDAGDYITAVFLQLEPWEDFLKMIIRCRARHLGYSKTKIHDLADTGDLETRINNLVELCGDDFNFICKDLQEWRERRNKVTHRKNTFSNETEFKDFCKETWLMGTTIIFNFMNHIENAPWLSEEI
jgi:hypothetical protein